MFLLLVICCYGYIETLTITTEGKTVFMEQMAGDRRACFIWSVWHYWLVIYLSSSVCVINVKNAGQYEKILFGSCPE